ncbi:MAG TPA: nucleotidyltransferase domain-containing protein, partial [Candidatus Hodarchaeales archaeon]|nr:nucleotidyltransferase domain-containing protein [Candidatus Hodarchaeales archaeon]
GQEVADMNELQTTYDARIKDLIVSAVEIASQCGCAMSIDELALLLPQGLEFGNIREILLSSPLISVSSGAEKELVVQKGHEHLFSERAYRNDVSSRYLETAKTFIDELTRRGSHVKLIGICGSVAYGSANESDDIDILLVTNRHRLWFSIFRALLLARVFKIKALIKGGKADFCLSYVQDEEHFEEEIMHHRTPMFAREFLSIHVLAGINYYKTFLDRTKWIGQTFPKLYAAKLSERVGDKTSLSDEKPSRNRIFDALDLFFYVIVRNYLLLKAFSLNLRYRKQRRMKDIFEVIITKGSCLYNSEKYRELEKRYKPSELLGDESNCLN